MQGHQTREAWSSKLSRITNSAVSFSLAYILFTYLFWLVMGFTGKAFGFASFIYYYKVDFILLTHLWSKLKVTAVFSSGPLLVLLLGLLSLYAYDLLKRRDSVFNLFLLWCFVIGTSMFGAQGVIAALGIGNYQSPFYQNFAGVYAWWRFPDLVVYILTIPFLILYVFFSVNYLRPFLRFAYSYAKVNKEKRRKKYFLEIVVVPFLIGCVITTAATFPMNIFIHAIYLMTIAGGLLIGWVTLHYLEVMRDEVLKYTSLQSFSVVMLFFLVMALIFVFTYGKGIHLSPE